jgi:DNA-binding CsgD family transcriptional regulator
VGSHPTASEIIHVAHHAVGDAALWDETAKLLSLRLDAAYVGFVEHNFVTCQGRIAHGWGFTADFRTLYENRYAAQNAWLRGASGLTAGLALTGAELVPNWELVRTDFYKSWLRPQNSFHCLMGVMLRHAEEVRCLVALRPLDEPAFGPEEKQTVVMLLPQLACANELDVRVTGIMHRRDVLEHVLGCLPEAVFVVDAESRLWPMNQAAQRLLGQDPGVTLSGGLAAASAPCEAAELRCVVARMASKNGCGGGSEVVVSRPSGKPPIVLTLEPLGHVAADTAGRPRNVAVAFTRQHQQATAVRHLHSLYHMTPAEARLAGLIVCGRTLAEAARELHITKNTARTHMKRIYAKTVTHRQADLVRLLISGAQLS